MILKALTLENFKGIREPVRIEFAPITLLFGPNSSGKSTVIKALQFASAIFNRAKIDPFDSSVARNFDLGSFREAVNGRDIRKTIGLTFDIELDSPLRVDLDPEGILDREIDNLDSPVGEVATESISHAIKSASVGIRIRYDDSVCSAYVSEFSVSVNAVRFGVIEYFPSTGVAQVSFLNYCHPLLIGIDPQYSSMGYDQGDTAYNAWLRDAGLSLDMDRNDLDGNGSNTALEDFVTAHNEAPWEGKSFPVRIDGGKSAIQSFASRMSLAMRKNLSRWTPDSDPETMKYRFASTIISEGFLTAAATLHDFLGNAVFLGPLRQIPARHSIRQRSMVQATWSAGEAAWDIIINADENFIAEVNAWLSRPDRLDSGYGVDVVRYRELPLDHPLMIALLEKTDLELAAREHALKQIPVHSRVVLRDKLSNIELSLQDVGVGLSQLLPVVVAALHDSQGFLSREQLVTVEQPELHLHPALQVRLADLFVANVKDRDKMFLLETHSEHLMLRCLRRIRETAKGIQADGIPPVTPADIAVHFVESTANGPRIRRIEIDDDGDFIDEWPGGFFEESYREKFAGR
jgi:hypothetical protein